MPKKFPFGICPGFPWKIRLKKSCSSAAEAGLLSEAALLEGGEGRTDGENKHMI